MYIFEHKMLHVLITIYHISMCYLKILPADWGFFPACFLPDIGKA